MSKVRHFAVPKLYEGGEIVGIQLSDVKYKGKIWIKYDEKIKEAEKF